MAISTGSKHACALKVTGDVWCWGDNEAGQMADGTTVERLLPTKVNGLESGAVAISVGDDHTCAITPSGAVKCWGWNKYGQIGDGTKINRLVATQVIGPELGVTAISSGGYHTCAITSAGGLQCWGRNDSWQVENSFTWEIPTPTQVVGLESGVTAISAGSSFTCALTPDGLKCWGQNTYGMLGNNTKTNIPIPTLVWKLETGVTRFSAGTHHACAVQSAGVLCWGRNSDGQLGDGTTGDELVPKIVGKLVAGVAAISAGEHNTCALTTEGMAMCWGNNQYGQIGDGSTTRRTTPTNVIGFP